MKEIIFLLLFVVLAGCSTIQEQGAKLTQKVCDMPSIERVALQSSVDSMTAPNKIRIECDGE
jgi:PBP1b-binding outer membrane lipoprotein LpoB